MSMLRHPHPRLELEDRQGDALAVDGTDAEAVHERDGREIVD
jgi:hypothetical protein